MTGRHRLGWSQPAGISAAWQAKSGGVASSLFGCCGVASPLFGCQLRPAVATEVFCCCCAVLTAVTTCLLLAVSAVACYLLCSLWNSLSSHSPSSSGQLKPCKPLYPTGVLVEFLDNCLIPRPSRKEKINSSL